MIVLNNGVRIFIRRDMKKDIYVGISNFGFDADIHDNIMGIAHLLEHMLISFDNKRFLANASTGRTFMSFWCKAINSADSLAAVNQLVSWFFKKDKLITNFSRSRLRDCIRELENEYYFRNELFHCMDVLTFLTGGELYNGGRIDMLESEDRLVDLMSVRMRRISGPRVIIFVRKLDTRTLLLLRNSFGTLPSCPESVPGFSNMAVTGHVAMIPSPFYTIMVRVEPTIDNILGILFLIENYNLVDYETVGEQLFIVLSFVNEHDYENMLRGTAKLSMSSINDLSFDVIDMIDDMAMNIYLNFPWISHDLYDYYDYVYENMQDILSTLQQEIYQSIINRDIVTIYPNFSQSIYNIQDTQRHKLIVMDIPPASSNVNIEKPDISLPLMLKQPRGNIVIKYGDAELLDFVSLVHTCDHKSIRLSRDKDGLVLQHRFSSDDIKTIMDSATFVKYSRSRPASTYQYIFLDFFASGRSIEDIIQHRDATLTFTKYNNSKLVFRKRARYDVTAKSSFVCGVVKGHTLDKSDVTSLMWDLKRQGLIYSLSSTQLRDKNTFYIFAFTIYPSKTFTYLSKESKLSSYCLIVANKGDVEDFSALHKKVVIKMN